jgi:hypothetical protein
MPTPSLSPARRQEENIGIPEPRLRILSLGAGVQSTTVLLMALHGEFPERLDCAIFADTGWEPKAVYEHLDWLERKAREGGIPVYRVSSGNLRQDLLDAVQERRKRVANPPFYVRNRDETGEYETPDRGGMLWRKCTEQYKIYVELKVMQSYRRSGRFYRR